ncbi:hypothetical protein PVAP13_1NG213138 [Panicum virgatum]|uniref:Uncharacterized protein n=1 Tax=Panicum virgatum TaxID=38727 RepID=A0A8T0X633_PANVG|nr:hypothetical protein PVAP13_1NG213138 [Panicum virgatum]
MAGGKDLFASTQAQGGQWRGSPPLHGEVVTRGDPLIFCRCGCSDGDPTGLRCCFCSPAWEPLGSGPFVAAALIRIGRLLGAAKASAAGLWPEVAVAVALGRGCLLPGRWCRWPLPLGRTCVLLWRPG